MKVPLQIREVTLNFKNKVKINTMASNQNKKGTLDQKRLRNMPTSSQVLGTSSTGEVIDNASAVLLKTDYDTNGNGAVDKAERIPVIAKNNSNSVSKIKGKWVYITNAQGGFPLIEYAQANAENTSSKTLGIILETIAPNATGEVSTIGTVRDMDTSAFLDGDSLWLSPTSAGDATTTRPTSPDHAVYLGRVIRSHPTQGELLISVQNGYEIEELHNVSESEVTTPQNGDFALLRDNTTSLWKRLSWSNIKVTLKAYFDTLYQDKLVSGTNLKTVASYSLLGSGDVALSKSDVGLSNVPNLDTTTAVSQTHTHTNKTVLDAIEQALTTALKTAYDTASSWVTTNGANVLAHIASTSNPHSVTKAQVGLGNVDNTSDANKPISSATQTALNGKQNAFANFVASKILFGNGTSTPVSDNNLHWDNTNKRLGIGTTAPSTPFNIESPVFPQALLKSTADVGIYLDRGAGATNQFRFVTAGTERWRFGCTTTNTEDLIYSRFNTSWLDTFVLQHSSGNVGLSQSNPSYRLDVNGTARIVTTPTISSATRSLVKDPSTGQISEQNTWLPRVQAVTSSATVTPNLDSDDDVVITAQAVALTIANPTGTGGQGKMFIIRIKDNGTARAITWGANYRGIGQTLPSTTVVSKTLYIGCKQNTTDSKIDVIAIAQE